jgi:hypothetical protein
MAYALVRIGYYKYVMPTDAAMVVAQALADAERYEAKYISADKREAGQPDYTHHIFPSTENITIELISGDMYRIAKLAGKSED